MMRAMTWKLLRDLAHMRGQVVAISLVMACGVATFVMSLSMLESLTGTLDTYYERNRFGDVFAHLERAPLNMVNRIGEIPGVAHAQPRIVERVTLDMPRLPEPASGQIISLPEDARTGLNLLHLRAGRYPEGRTAREVLVSEAFARAHELDPGDTVEAIMNGRLETLRIAGIALSPEFIYLIAPGSLFPDDKRFGVFWMGREEMAAAFDMEGAFNDLIVRLMPGADESEVIARIDDITDRDGGLGAYGRADHASHKFIANEIKELRGMTLVVPMIFLGVAAFLLNIVLSRMIAVQREQIAAIKALGYAKWEIGRHYAGFVVVITLAAVMLGTFGGALMGRGLTAMYAIFFSFPAFQYELRPAVMLAGLTVSLLAASVGVTHALYMAMRLPPAEAMRPQAPMSFRPTVLERIGLHRLLPASIRMIVRQLERRPIKTALSCLGIALATAILVGGAFAEDAIDYVMDFQFNRVQRYDVDVVFAAQTDDRALSSVRHVSGVHEVEPYRGLAVRIRHGHRSRRTGIMGLADDDGLYRLLDIDGQPVALPESGLLLSSALAGLLDVRVGQSVTVEVMEGRRPIVETIVAGTIDDFAGLSAYMRLDALNRLMHEQRTVGGAFLTADAAQMDALYQELREAPRVMAVNVKTATLQSFEETVAEAMLMMRSFIVFFACIIAFGVVYNSARISLSERSRDLATLRVVGFTRGEISVIQLGELAIITAIAIPLGLLLGYLMAIAVSAASPTELFRIPVVVDRSTLAFAALIVTVAAVLSGLVVRRRLDRLDLVSVLKARE